MVFEARNKCDFDCASKIPRLRLSSNHEILTFISILNDAIGDARRLPGLALNQRPISMPVFNPYTT